MTLLTIRSLWLASAALCTALLVFAPEPARAQCASCSAKCGQEFQACSNNCIARFPRAGFRLTNCFNTCNDNSDTCEIKCLSTACSSGLTGTWLAVEQVCGPNGCGLDAAFEAVNPAAEATPNNALLRVHLSTDAVLSDDDAVLGEVALGVVQAGGSKIRRLHLAANGGSLTGLYLIAHADADNDVPELNEDNNVVPYGPIP